MRVIKKSRNATVMVLVTSATDHISGMDGLTLAVSISKNGSNFEVIAPDIASISNGWYRIDLEGIHTDIVGDLVLHITAASADPTDILMNVVEYTNDEIGLMVSEMHLIQGLNSASPSTTTRTSWVAGDIEIQISGNGETTTTMTRQ